MKTAQATLGVGPGGVLGTLVVAIPMRDVDDTLHHLLVIEMLVAAGILLALAGLAWWVVRLGLRPLDRMGETAGAIAAGDLSRRVEPADDKTEVGRLGLSLNSMLGQIEVAFAERTASETRLRRFVADASHELRTPLTSIRGYAELFRRGASTRPDDLAKTMRRIEEAAARMGVLVDDLLLLARLDQGRPLEHGPVDLTRLVAAAVDDLRATSPERPVTYESDGAIVVNGDEFRLRQVLANLLENARTHTPPSTPVEVRVAQSGDDAIIEVRDHGPGMSAEDAARSNGSGAPIRRARGRAAGPGSASRSSRRSPRRTAVTPRSRRRPPKARPSASTSRSRRRSRRDHADALSRKDRKESRSERVEFLLGVPKIEDLDLAIGLESDMVGTPFGGSRACRVELLHHLVVLGRRESTMREVEPECHKKPRFGI